MNTLSIIKVSFVTVVFDDRVIEQSINSRVARRRRLTLRITQRTPGDACCASSSTTRTDPIPMRLKHPDENVEDDEEEGRPGKDDTEQ